MRALKRILTVTLMVATLSMPASTQFLAFGQKNDNRPPKEPDKVKERDKPPKNSNSQGNSNRKKP